MKASKAPQFKTILPTHWNKNRLNAVLGACVGKKLLVVGDVGVDRYTIGTVERISPEAPVPIVRVTEEKLKLGLAANVADNIQVLGGIPLLVGVVGKDRGASDFKELLKTSKIKTNYLVSDSSRRTVFKERIVGERQQLVRIDYESEHSLDSDIERAVLDQVKAVLPQVDGVILEDYAKGMLTPSLASAFFRMVEKAGKLVAVDPNLKSPVDLYRGAGMITPNTKEAEHLSGISIRDESSLAEAGFTLLRKTRAHSVMITRGKDGMAIFSRGSSEVRLIPTYAREVFDVSGAGDTVISVIVLALVSGASIEEASVLANLAAGVEVGKTGTATVTPEEIRKSMDFFELVGG